MYSKTGSPLLRGSHTVIHITRRQSESPRAWPYDARRLWVSLGYLLRAGHRDTGPPTGAEIASTPWLLSIGTLHINSAEFAKATSVAAVPQSNTPFPGNANHSQVEAQAAAGGLTTTQCEELGAPWGQYDSCHPDYKLDLRPCPQCHGPMEYCHGQNSFDPVLIPAPRPPIFVPPPAASARGMAQVCGPHTEAAVLAAQIACLIREDNEDIIEIPEPPFYPTNKRPA